MTKLLHPYLFTAKELAQPIREGFGQGLLDAALQNDKILGICPDLTDSVKMDAFAKTFPERFWNPGIMEQHSVSMAAGLALSGFTPFVASYGSFLMRALDQFRISVCLSKANVKLISSHCGINTGPDGASAQCLEDISMIRALPNVTVIVPCDAVEARKATIALSDMTGPAYMRFGREKSPIITQDKTPFLLGRAETLLDEGNDCTIIACGSVVYEALVAARHLSEQNLAKCKVINMHTIKPIDKEAIVDAAKQTGAVVTIEDHQKTGGLGSIVADVLAERYPTPMHIIGVADEFGRSGTAQELYTKYGLTAEHVQKAVVQLMKRK